MRLQEIGSHDHKKTRQKHKEAGELHGQRSSLASDGLGHMLHTPVLVPHSEDKSLWLVEASGSNRRAEETTDSLRRAYTLAYFRTRPVETPTGHTTSSCIISPA